MTSDEYMKGVAIVGTLTAIIVFLACWIYCIATYGFLLGVGLGWLPAGITAVVIGLIAGYLWPLTVLAVLGVMYVVMEATT